MSDNISDSAMKRKKKRKKYVKIIKRSIFIILLLAIFFVVSQIVIGVKIIYRQNTIGETLPDTFRIELPVIRNHSNYFCVEATVNDTCQANFIFDTNASCLAKIETVDNMNMHKWSRWPVAFGNYYGQIQMTCMYHFDSFKIQSLTFNRPLFEGIPKSNTMYDLMTEDVLGRGFIKALFWKFALDDEKMILFSNKDSLLLQKETENFVKIDNGLHSNELFFPDISMTADFIFDTGYSEEIMVNEKIFTVLSEKFTPKIYIFTRRTLAKNDISYVFDNMNVEWGGIKISNCQVIYSPITDRCLIGSPLLDRFNFVFAYNEKVDYRIKDNLYLQPRNNFQQFESIPYCSDFGFYIRKSGNEFNINMIEQGGLADKAGIRLKDKIISIDHGDFDLSNLKELDSYLSDKKTVHIAIEKKGKVTEIVLTNR